MLMEETMTKKKFNNEIEEDKLQQEICNDFHEWTMAQMVQSKPVLVLMTILGQTLKIMKTTLPPAEYESIMDNVYNSRNRIEPFTKPTIN